MTSPFARLSASLSQPFVAAGLARARRSMAFWVLLQGGVAALVWWLGSDGWRTFAVVLAAGAGFPFLSYLVLAGHEAASARLRSQWKPRLDSLGPPQGMGWADAQVRLAALAFGNPPGLVRRTVGTWMSVAGAYSLALALALAWVGYRLAGAGRWAALLLLVAPAFLMLLLSARLMLGWGPRLARDGSRILREEVAGADRAALDLRVAGLRSQAVDAQWSDASGPPGDRP